MALPTAKRRKVSSDARVINRPEAPYKARGDEENRPLEHENGFDSPSTGHKEDEAEVELDQRTTEQPSEHRPTAQDPRKIRRGPLPSTLDSLGSSIFNLEVEELLARLRKSNPQQTKLLDVALRRLKARIEGYAPQAELPAHEAEMLIYKLHHIVVPFPEPKPRKNVNWKVAYAKPAHINIIGGYALETLVKGNDDVSIDLAVTMPSSLFAEKDYLDYRYFHKRAYYLACLAAALSQDDDSRFKLTFQYLNGNTLHPVLLAEVVEESAAQDAKNFKGSIRIMPVAPEGTFPLLKTLPHRNCIRSDPPSAEPGSVSEKVATPFYNASLQLDCSVTSYLKFLHAASVQCPGFRDACILGRVWLRQRGLGSSLSRGGFGQFEWGALMAILLRGGGPQGRRILSSTYSSAQLFKAMLQFLTARDLMKTPLSFEADLSALAKADRPCVLDGPRGLNILFKMTTSSYEMLRREAKLSLQMLDDSHHDHFDALFIHRADEPLLRFDSIIHLPVSDRSPAASAILQQASHSNSSLLLVNQKIHEILSLGLGNRVRSVYVAVPDAGPWSLNSSYAIEPTGHLLIGLVHDPINVGRTMDYGPSAEDKAAAAFFRQFWGSIAELRRFKDGSILESISWSGAGGPTKILQQAVKYLLNRHVGSGVGDSAAFEGDEAPLLLVGLDITGTQSIAPFKPLMTAFADLERSMRELEGFPLQLRQISATHPATRYASVHIPSSNGRGVAETTPIDVTIQFEGSGRWPDDLMAIQRTKIALLLKLGEMLEESVDGLNARVGLENTEYELLNCCFLDVTQSDGTTFRLRIHNDREEILLERHLNHKDRSPRDRDEAVLALATYKRDFRHLARHTRNVRTICTRFPPLSPTMRLLKVWFASHLLSGHVSEEVIEMIAIRSFLQPLPWEAPSSVRVGFLRILHFLSRWDWRVEPLVIDFGGDISGQDRAIISTRFEAWRKIDPGMNKLALFVASNVDLDGTTFTHMGPSKPVAARMTTLARAAFDIVKTAGQSLMQEALFASSTADFDFVIHLAPPFVRADARQKSKQVPQFKNLQTPSDPGRDTVGYEPVQLFLTDLRVGAPNKAQSPRDQQADWRQALFSANILFFHNPVAGSIIAGIWSPSTGPRPWKVNQSYSTVPLAPEGGDETARININKPAILNDIARLGGDLITRIELHR